VQNWSLTAILDEYRAFAGSKGRITHEQYIEFFDVDLVTLPAEDGRLPAWFEDYNLTGVREQSLRLENLRERLKVLEAKQGEEASVKSVSLIPQSSSSRLNDVASSSSRLDDREKKEKRRILFELRLWEAQRSTMVCSPDTRMGKQSLVDDDSDD
jgi:hypothetical protein